MPNATREAVIRFREEKSLERARAQRPNTVAGSGRRCGSRRRLHTVTLLIGDHGAIRDGAHGCRGYRKGSRE